MGLIRMVALGAAGALAYRFWKQQKAQRSVEASYDFGYETAVPPQRDAVLGSTTAGLTPEPAVAASQSSRGFGDS